MYFLFDYKLGMNGGTKLSSENKQSQDENDFKGVLDEYKIGKYGGAWLSARHTAFILLPMLPAFVVTILLFMLLLLVVDWFFSVPYLNLSILWPYLGYPQPTFIVLPYMGTPQIIITGFKDIWQTAYGYGLFCSSSLHCST